MKRKQSKKEVTLGDLDMTHMMEGYSGSSLSGESVGINPLMALVVSRCGHGNQKYLLTKHEFKKGNVLGAGCAVDASIAVQLLAEVAGMAEIVWTDDKLLRCSSSGFTWYLPPAVRPMLWAIGQRTITLRVPWPGLLFDVSLQKFRIYAYTGNGRPTPKTQLFHAPVPNVFQNATMCWGNIEEPTPRIANRQAFEDAVVKTRGTHANHTKAFKSQKNRDDMFTFFKALHTAKATEFPKDELVAVGSAERIL